MKLPLDKFLDAIQVRCAEPDCQELRSVDPGFEFVGAPTCICGSALLVDIAGLADTICEAMERRLHHKEKPQ